MDYVAEAVAALYAKRDQIKGLEMVYEPKTLRFFTARFQPIEVAAHDMKVHA
jgi:tyrosine phenol-lyase